MPADLTTLLFETLRKKHNRESNCVSSFVLTRHSTKCLFCPTYLQHTPVDGHGFDQLETVGRGHPSGDVFWGRSTRFRLRGRLSRFYDILMAPNSIRSRDRRRPFKLYGGDLSLRRVHGRCYQCQQ